jgi:hypothetical protein
VKRKSGAYVYVHFKNRSSILEAFRIYQKVNAILNHFSDFCQFLAKMALLFKNQCNGKTFCHEVFLVKIANFFSNFFAKIFKKSQH